MKETEPAVQARRIEMFVLIATLAAAAEATRCEAHWEGPVAGCQINGDVVTYAAARNENAADRAARRRIARVLELTAEDLQDHGVVAQADVGSCAQSVADGVAIDCHVTASARQGSLCFVTFDDRACWTGAVLTIEQAGWQAVVEGRSAMCAQVDARLDALNYRDEAVRREQCQESCLTRAVVSCPSDD